MVIDQIRFDRVEIVDVHSGTKNYVGCYVSLNTNGTASIQYSGNVSYMNIPSNNLPIMMTDWRVIEFKPWLMRFSAKMNMKNMDVEEIRYVEVFCIFNMFGLGHTEGFDYSK